jgi:hypothetical protein
MLLRNLNIKQGFCNGVRLRVLENGHRFLKCEIITGSHSGNIALLLHWLYQMLGSIFRYAPNRRGCSRDGADDEEEKSDGRSEVHGCCLEEWF